MEGGFFQTALIIFIMVAILFGAYYATKFLAKRGKRLTQSKHIKVVDQIYIASDKQIALIDVGGEKVLIGVTNQNINLISKIESSRIESDTEAESTKSAAQPAFVSKIAEFIKKAKSSPYDLQRARQEERKSREEKKHSSTNEDESFDKILKSIDDRKRQFDAYRKDENDEN